MGFEARVIMALLVTAFLVFGHYLLTDDTRTPVKIERVEILNSPASVEGPVEVRVWRQKVRSDCAVFSKRTAFDENGHVYDMQNREWAGGNPANPYVDLKVYPERPMPKGSTLFLDMVATYNCSRGRQFVVALPLIAFTVEDHP